MIKGKKIIESMGDKKAIDEIREKECFLCEVHSKAREEIPNADWFACPKCGTPIIKAGLGKEDLIVVGETNSGPIEEEIFRKVVSSRCPGCGELVALIPEIIFYNANHDVYYTGGRLYVWDDVEIKEAIEKNIKPLIENFVQRVKGGEGLEAWNLSAWLKGGVEHIVAEYLYKRGIKK